MEKYCQLVIGPYGSGKTTYCDVMKKHYSVNKRVVEIINLDPAAEDLVYEPIIDVRELITADDVMESDLKLGSNGASMYCMKYLIENFDWLFEAIEESSPDYIIIDCPGQVELYTNGRYIPQLVESLIDRQFKVGCVYMLDSSFLIDPYKFIHGIYAAQAAMFRLSTCPTVNLLSKIDLLSKKSKRKLQRYLEPDSFLEIAQSMQTNPGNEKLQNLLEKMADALDQNTLVNLQPFDISDSDSIMDVMSLIDIMLNYDDDSEIKESRNVHFFSDRAADDHDCCDEEFNNDN